MAALRQMNLCKITSISHGTIRNFHLNPIVCDAKWRQKNNLPRNPTAFGPLTNLPDYSFADGRPVPFGINQKKRIDEQRENLVRMKELVSEIDNAVIKHEERLRMAEEEKQRILGRKLKAKGDKLLLGSTQTMKLSDGESQKRDSKLLTGDSKETS